MKYLKISILLCIILLTGCATINGTVVVWYRVAVDSLASPDVPSGRTYILLPGNEGVTPADLQFQEYAEYLKRVLNKKGYTFTDSAEEADTAVFLSYGIGDPETYHYSYNFPVLGERGVYSHTYITKTTKGDRTTYNRITTYTPRYGIWGYGTYIGSGFLYNRFALITAYDYEHYKKEEKEVQFWKTTVTSTGTSDDLRRVFPVLMAASVPYLGTNTGHKIYIRIHDNEDIVRDIRGETLVNDQ